MENIKNCCNHPSTCVNSHDGKNCYLPENKCYYFKEPDEDVNDILFDLIGDLQVGHNKEYILNKYSISRKHI